MLATPSPVITPYDPGRDDPADALLALDLEESLQRYVDDRARLVARLRQLSPTGTGLRSTASTSITRC